MKQFGMSLIAISISVFATPGSIIANEKLQDVDEAAFFKEHIEPILVAKCLECHGSEKKGGLDLRTAELALEGGESGPAIERKQPAESLLYEYVLDEEMPPEHPLSDEEIESLKRWIEMGAYFPQQPLDLFAATSKSRAGYDWWSLQPLGSKEPPRVDHASLDDSLQAWSENPIDRFVLAELLKQNLKPSPAAASRPMIRRATFDLLGLPPTPEEVSQFLAACQAETGDENRVGDRAYEQLIHRLLKSKHYGEQWGRHWLDVVRFGESNGFERNVIHQNVWPFRDYVIQSINDDKPFDRLIVEHLAGDVLAPNDLDVAVGTAFLVCGPYDNVGNRDAVAAAQIRADTIDEMIRATGEAFLGLTIGCGRCHNHKFDPISQRDYYKWYATFAGVRHGDRILKSEQALEVDQEIAQAENSMKSLQEELRDFDQSTFAGRTIVLDDEKPVSEKPVSVKPSQPGVMSLQEERGHGQNPMGEGRGFLNDRGNINRTPNLSQGRYHWWDNRPEANFFTWNPAAEGAFRVWLSWGCGFGTHTNDARYLIDRDGDLETTDDQELIATVDQRRFSDQRPRPNPKKALWSGFLDAGVHQFGPSSRIVLRGGSRGTAIAADVVVLQETSAATDENATSTDGNIAENGQPVFRQPIFRQSVRAKTNLERFTPTTARFLRFTILETNSREPCIDELEVYTTEAKDRPSKNVAAVNAGAKATSSGNYPGNSKHQLAHINDGKYGNSFSWISNDDGERWVQIEFADLFEIDRIVWGRDREEKFSDRLATRYKIEVASKPGNWLLVSSSDDRLPLGVSGSGNLSNRLAGLTSDQALIAQPLFKELAALKGSIAELKKKVESNKWWVGNFQVAQGPFHVFGGGSPQRPQIEVTPASLSILNGKVNDYELESSSPESDRRLELAKWIVADENPLTPRVLVNRIWHYHFGTGIVNTPSDFGYMGGRPSHPQLLDWLATRLKEEKWQIKALHREIMMSQTYRQSSQFREGAASVDADSRLLWRFPPRRLSAEEIRDSALSVSGSLDTRMGGLGFRLFEYVQDNVATYHPLDEHPIDTYRRAVYHHRARAMQIDLMTEFDSPDCAFSAPRRSVTTTPLQALTLMNHSFTVDMAAAFENRLVSETAQGESSDDQVRRAFLLCYTRLPQQGELEVCSKFVKENGLAAFCRVLLNSNEFIYLN